MNYDIIFDNSTDIFIVKTSGKMTGERFVDMAQDLLRHSQWVPGGNVIFDHIDLDFSDVSVADLEAIRSVHKENENQIGAGKSAIVVRPGFSQKWHKLWSHGQKIQTENKILVFEDFNHTVQWIKKHDGTLDP